MDVFDMKKSDIIALSKNLPTSSKYSPLEFDSVLVIPTRTKHDSGYNCILVIGCNKGEAVCKITDWSDDLKFNTIDKDDLFSNIRMDCLPNGVLRVWGKQISIDGYCVSTVDFNIKNR